MALEKPSQRWVFVGGLLAVIAGVAPLIVRPVTGQIRVTLIPDEERDKSSGVLQVFRGLQMSLADICYNKSTVYQHSGILYQIEDEDIVSEDIRDEQRGATVVAESTSPTAPIALKGGKKAVTTAAAHKTGDHEHEEDQHVHPRLTTISPREQDFRGIIGDVERAVKPFDLAHVRHVKPEEALPWLRLATWINPDHEMAWVATAFWLQGTKARNANATSQAIALLEQARLLNLPREGRPFEKHGLVYELAHLYLMEAKNPARALEILEPIVTRGEKDFAQLDPVQRDWLSFNFRDTVEACKKLGLHEKAVEYGRRGVALFPDDGPLRVSLRREIQLLQKGKGKAPAPSSRGKN